MNVISIRRNQLFGDYKLQGVKSMPEWTGFFAGAALTVFGQAFLYDVGSGQLFLLYLMAVVGTLGSLIGIAMFERPTGYFLVRLPLSGIPRIPRGTRMGGLKKAA